MTDREAWGKLKPIIKAHIDGDRELTLAYVKVSQAIEKSEFIGRQHSSEQYNEVEKARAC